MRKNKLDIMFILVLLTMIGVSWLFSNQQVHFYNQAVEKNMQVTQRLTTNQHQLNKLESELNIKYQYDYATQRADPTVTHFFKIMRTYNSSKTYNARRDKVIRAKLAGADVTQSDLFKTDHEETGENYVDNSHMSSNFNSAKVYADKVSNDVLAGKVLVKYTMTTEQGDAQMSMALYDVRYDLVTNQITEMHYDYGINGVLGNG
ncbi:hypothetical protein D3P96_08280 [Weissella viridescens]|uniref:Uncharacterized protein n=1 Tax=Weissella viridescens TaxID=1629 RepID=A0A3P2RA67_WEIVI|nr:hypothetical protein [Weissella viridescens]RRG17333.1 hypothetical protein D3P96_08280 [Weissella viridescens]